MAENAKSGQDNDQPLLLAEGLSKSYGRLFFESLPDCEVVEETV